MNKSVFVDRVNAMAAFKYLTTVLALFALLATALPADAAKRRNKARTSSHQVEGPLTLIVSLGRQRVTVFDKHGKVTSAPISSGQRGHRTPTGVFSILQKRRRHYSNLYRGASMPNMQRLTWSGVALHAGHLPGYPASHGCIRLPYSFSRQLFSMTKLGTRVVVTNTNVAPQSFAHENLLKPLPPGDPAAYAIEPAEPTDTNGKKASNAANMLFGVTPAEAAEYSGLPTGVERTRAAVEAYRVREISMLESAVEKAKSLQEEVGEELKTANQALRDAVKAEHLLQPESGKINKRLTAAEEALAAARRNFRDFLLRSSAFLTDEQLSRAALEEEALEADALRHLTELDLALADRDALDDLINVRQSAIEKATARRDLLKDRYITAKKSLASTRDRLKDAKKAYERRKRPITVLLSKHSNKLYVRQGYDPVLDADIEFEIGDAPIGTHFFHATGYSKDGTDLTWQAVTAARKTLKRSKSKRYRKSRKAKKAPLFDPSWPDQTPANALNRVKIPADVRERLAELMKPGSAIIVTDERKSYETGKYTDLIVLTR